MSAHQLHREVRKPPLILWPAAWIPLINVTLLLLGFVLLSPVMQTPSGVPFELPQTLTAEALTGPSATVIITEQESLYLNGTLTTLEEFPQLFESLQLQGQTILIQVDRRVPLGQVAQVWDLCRRLGARRIHLATTSTEGLSS